MLTTKDLDERIEMKKEIINVYHGNLCRHANLHNRAIWKHAYSNRQ